MDMLKRFWSGKFDPQLGHYHEAQAPNTDLGRQLHGEVLLVFVHGYQMLGCNSRTYFEALPVEIAVAFGRNGFALNMVSYTFPTAFWQTANIDQAAYFLRQAVNA